MGLALRVKSELIGSQLENLSKLARRAVDAPRRWRHPELCGIYLQEKQLPHVVQKLLRNPDDCGVDVGAHIGSFLSLLIHYAPSGQHVAIEPSPYKARILERRFLKASIIEAALSDGDGTAMLEDDKRGSAFAHLGARGHPVKILRLDSLGLERIDLLKIDVEGHELPALRGAEMTLAKVHAPIIFECGPECERTATAREALFNWMTNHGYGVHSFSDFLFDRGPMKYDEFRRCGIYPFSSFDFVAIR